MVNCKVQKRQLTSKVKKCQAGETGFPRRRFILVFSCDLFS